MKSNRTPENIKDKDLKYIKVTPNYTIDEFGRIVTYKKSNKLVVQSVWPEDNQERSEWI